MENIYDAIVVGGGPAGCSAAIYLKRAGKNVVILERMALGGQLNNISHIANYLGFAEIDGITLTTKIEEQVKGLNIPVIFEEVTDFELTGKVKHLRTRRNDYQSKCVILALGGRVKELGIEGEKEFKGRGVSYCAECDGNFFKGKEVAVIGNNQKAFDSAIYLSSLAQNVYLLTRENRLSFELEQIKNRANISVIEGVIPIKLTGSEKLEKFIFMQNGHEKTLPIDGCFVANGDRPNSEPIYSQVELSNDGYIICDENMQTSQKGVFACGDARKSNVKQISTAVGDGALAAIMACKYLTGVDEENY